MKRHSHIIFLLFTFQLLLFASCTQLDVFEKNTPIPDYNWKSGFAATGSFTIKDTASTYNISLVLRHNDAYKYNNIWLNIGLQYPGDSMRYRKFELQLATDASGWEGSGMNDIWEVRKPLELLKFKKQGNYIFNITQIMRDNPLQHVMSAGLRVQKVKLAE